MISWSFFRVDGTSGKVPSTNPFSRDGGRTRLITLHRSTPMAKIDAERNLLFGVLALQMDFISREALITATSTWVLDKSKTLAQVLVEQGALSASRRALLEPLVQEHLRAHGDDPHRSLAS